MKKLTRDQMKKVIGGLEELPPADGGDYGCAACGASCSISGGGHGSHPKCCSGMVCKDQGSERGSICD